MAINIPIFSSLDTKGFDKLKREFASLESNSDKAAFVLKKAMLPAAAAIGAVGTALGAAAMAAAEDQKSQAAFENQVRNSVGALNGQIESLNQYVTATQMANGVSDTLVRQGLGNLLRATRDQTQAQKLFNLSLDISAATGKAADEVALSLGKAYQGNFTALKKLGVPLDENTVKTKNFDAAAQQLADTFGGAAAAQANTFDGKLKRLKERFGELWESIGYKVLPILDNLLTKVLDLVDAFNEGGVAGAVKVFRSQLYGLARDSDGTINSFGHFVNALITVRNAIAHVVNAFIRMANVLPFIDDISTIQMVDQLGTNFAQLYGTLAKTTLELEKQKELKGFIGPVSSRDIHELANNYEAYKEQLRLTTDNTDALDTATTKAGATAKKHTQAVKEQAKAVKDDLAKAYEAAVNALKDKFSPALKDANDKLTAAQDIYNNFYKSIHDSITAVGDLGAAWNEAAGSEGAKTFFGVLKDQSDKANKLANNLETLIKRGLDNPALLQSILSAGTDTGLAISQAIIDGGDAALGDLKEWGASIGGAADRIAKLTADNWYKSGVDQAQAIVDGINSVIKDTEFALQFTLDPASIAAMMAMFTNNVNAINAGGTATPMFNPADFTAAANMALGQQQSVTTSSVNINVNGGDPNAVVQALRTYMRQNGSVPIKIGNAY